MTDIVRRVHMKQNKVAVNLNQDFTEEEQTTARGREV